MKSSASESKPFQSRFKGEITCLSCKYYEHVYGQKHKVICFFYGLFLDFCRDCRVQKVSLSSFCSMMWTFQFLSTLCVESVDDSTEFTVILTVKTESC